jgi:hypothetical protein
VQVAGWRIPARSSGATFRKEAKATVLMEDWCVSSVRGVTNDHIEECRERAAECREMAEREANAHVRAVPNDMARSWERLALQAAQFTNQAQMGFSFGTISQELESVRRE